MATSDEEKTAALEGLIRGVNPLTDNPIAFLDQIEAIIGQPKSGAMRPPLFDKEV